MMDRSHYTTRLHAVLDDHREDIASRLANIAASLPEQATGLDIAVHPDQDEEGFATVMVHAAGPDLFVLNKAIAPDRALLEVKMGANGRLNADLPMFDPFDLPFPVGDTQVEAVASWFATHWPAICPAGFSKPVSVSGADGFGPARPNRLTV